MAVSNVSITKKSNFLAQTLNFIDRHYLGNLHKKYPKIIFNFAPHYLKITIENNIVWKALIFKTFLRN
jgi:hypothetical protein